MDFYDKSERLRPAVRPDRRFSKDWNFSGSGRRFFGADCNYHEEEEKQ